MKKLLSVLLVLTMLFSAAALVACGGKKEQSAPAAASGTVTWKNYDGSTIRIDTDLPGGTVPVFGQANPTHPDDADGNSYVFDGWDPEPVPVNGDAVYTAKYRAISHTVTVGDYAAAFNFAGQNFTMEATYLGGKNAGTISLRQLEDSSFVYKMDYVSEEAEDEYFAYLREDDGTYTLYWGSALKNGMILWEMKEKGGEIADVNDAVSEITPTFVAAVPFQNYAYDSASRVYKATYGEAYIEIYFENRKMVKLNCMVEGSQEFVFSNYGTTVISEEEMKDIRTSKLVLSADEKGEYYDSDTLGLFAKAGETVECEVIAAIEIPKNFDPATNPLILGAQFSNTPEDNNAEPSIYTNEDVSFKLFYDDRELTVDYDSEGKGYLADISDLVKEPGVYTFRVVIRVLKDLKPTGDNEVLIVVGII